MLYLSIILQLWLVRCVIGRPLPCTKVDDDHGSMLCCDYQPLPHEEGSTGVKAQINQRFHSEKKCTLMIPKTSLGFMKEVWSMRNYTWATGMLETKLPETKDIPRLADCCCQEQFVFSISNEGISAQTGKTYKIVQQDQHVQPKLSLVCVRNEDCQNSGTMKVFQRMEAHSHYVESEDHPEYVHEELLLKPSGCLCVSDTQAVKADIGEILIPMDLIEEAMTDSHIVKRHAEYHTELPEILQLALEIMREPNPLPVLGSIERQMALQLQQTRYFAAMAMAAGLGGRGFGPEYSNAYHQTQQGNATEADSYQLILSAFLSGLALGQNFQNFTQVEILDRLIADNGNTGINLLETILEIQNHSLAVNYSSTEFIDNTSKVIDYGVSSPIYGYATNELSSPTYDYITSELSSPAYVTKTIQFTDTAYVTDSGTSSPTYATTSELSSQTYVITASDLTTVISNRTYVIDSGSSSEVYVTTSYVLSSTTYYAYYDNLSSTTYGTSTATVVDASEKTVIHTSREDSVTAYSSTSTMVDASTEATIGVPSNEVDDINFAPTENRTTSSDKEYTSAGADSHVYFDEEAYTNTPAVFDDTEHGSTEDYSAYFDESASSKTPAVYDEPSDYDPSEGYSAYFDEASTKTPAVFGDAAEHHFSEDYSAYFDENVSTKTPAVYDEPTDYEPSEGYSAYFDQDTSTKISGVFEDTVEHHFSEGYSAYLDEMASTRSPDMFDDATEHGSSESYSAYLDEDASTKTTAVFDDAKEHGPSEGYSAYVDEDAFTVTPAVFDDTTRHVYFSEGYSDDFEDASSKMSEVFDDGFTTYEPAVSDVVHVHSNVDHTIESTTGSVGHIFDNEDYNTDIVWRTEESGNIVYNEDGTYAETMNGTTAKPDLHTSLNQDLSTNTDEIVGSTSDPNIHTSYSQDHPTYADNSIDRTAEPNTQTSYNQDDSTHDSERTGSTAEPASIFYNKNDSTSTIAMLDTTEKPVVHTFYNDIDTNEPGVTISEDEDVTTSNISAETEIPEFKFNLREYIEGLPQFQPLTIDTELLMHIMFPPEPISGDERFANA